MPASRFAIAAVCRLALFLVGGHSSVGTGNRYVSDVVGIMMIFVVAGIGAAIAALLRRARGNDLPGLQTGFAVALAFTMMVYMNSKPGAAHRYERQGD